jgi:hypothetical protein
MKRATIPLIVAIACSALFLAASWIVTYTDKAAIRTHIATAYATGEMRSADYDDYNAANYNHCLVLYMLAAPYGTRWEEVIAPKVPPGWRPCPSLYELVSAQPQDVMWPYERYWHGMRTVIAPLVATFEIGTALIVFKAASGLLLLLALGGLIWRRKEPGLADTPFFGVGAALLICIVAFYVSPYRFGASLAFAASDLAIYAMLAVLVLVDQARLTLRSTLLLASLLGAVIAYLEWLTGQAPLGLTVLLAITAAAPHTQAPSAFIQRAVWTVYGFVAGFAATFTAKIAIVSATGVGSASFVPLLLGRMGGDIPKVVGDILGTRLGIDISQHTMYSPASIAYAAAKVGESTALLGRGSLGLGLSVVLLACIGLVGGGWARWCRLPDPRERARTTLLIAAALVTPGWYLIFLNHTILHDFMVRALVGFVAIGLWFGASELTHAVGFARSKGVLPASLGTRA